MPRAKPRLTLIKNSNLEAVIYARVSSKEQAETGYSIEAQLQLLRDYASAKGLTVVQEFVESETAKESGRYIFGEMLRIIKKKGIPAIICEKTDRLYRNLHDRVKVGDMDLHLHFVKENTILSRDSRSHDKFVHDLNLVIAKRFIDNLSEEAKKGLLEKVKQGGWPTVAPIGYKNVAVGSKRGIEPDEMAPKVVELYKKYATGRHSMNELTKWARTIGLKSRHNKPIAKNSIWLILTNPVYYGCIRWHGQDYPGNHQPLIDRHLFERAQAVAASRTSVKTGFGTRNFIYQGMFACGVCGCAMTQEIKKGTYIYYRCTGHRGCDKKGVREELITAQVVAELRAIAFSSQVLDDLRKAMRTMHDTIVSERDAEVANLEKERKRLQNALERLYTDRLQEKVAPSVYDRFNTDWQAQLLGVEKMLAALSNASRKHRDETIAMLEAAQNAFRTYEQATDEHKREIAKELLSNSTITNGEITLKYKPWVQILVNATQDFTTNPALKTDFVYMAGATGIEPAT